jgi:hypothetical protein
VCSRTFNIDFEPHSECGYISVLFSITWYLVIADVCGGRYPCAQKALNICIVLVLFQVRKDQTIRSVESVRCI